MKQQILDDICLKLNDLQIPYSLKDDSLISVSTKFYDVGFGTEPRIVLYELSVLLDEAQQSVFLYVKTVDQCIDSVAGTGKASAPSFSIFRKVKRVTYDTNGISTVTTVDLGEVPNTVKNTTFKHGWKFRTALSLKNPVKKAAIAENIRRVAPIPPVKEIVHLSEPELHEPTPATTATVDRPVKGSKVKNLLRFVTRRGKGASRR